MRYVKDCIKNNAISKGILGEISEGTQKKFSKILKNRGTFVATQARSSEKKKPYKSV